MSTSGPGTTGPQGRIFGAFTAPREHLRAPSPGDGVLGAFGSGTISLVDQAKEEYVEQVLSLVEQIPPGRVTTYGAIAAVVGGGPRQVGSVMSQHGAPVPWWRVVRADGSLPPSHDGEARACYAEEGTPCSSTGRVQMRDAFWDPAELA